MEVFEERLTEWAKAAGGGSPRSTNLTQEYLQSRATRGWVAGRARAHGALGAAQEPGRRRLCAGCAPENEATIYRQALDLNLWPKASRVRRTGQADRRRSRTSRAGRRPALANQALGIESGYDYDFVAGTGHLLQIEKPDECVRLVEEFLRKYGM